MNMLHPLRVKKEHVGGAFRGQRVPQRAVLFFSIPSIPSLFPTLFLLLYSLSLEYGFVVGSNIITPLKERDRSSWFRLYFTTKLCYCRMAQ